MTEEEYLDVERKALEKSEYYRGECFAMAGASRRHNVLTRNTIRLLGNHLANKPCEPYVADMRLKIETHKHYVYPDIMVVCDEKAYINEDMVNDAAAIVEVLSPSTEQYDRGQKFLHYQSLPSLKEYVLISQETMQVEIYQRRDDGKWIYQVLAEPDEQLILPSIDFSCSLKELYASIPQ
ncbi:MAG: Uma2 family endonuclease [bacterium]|nr:Uma2 family endonuclease [bacterium]